ncbi:MAG: hypothetical protein K9K86_02305 [Pseudomonadales bacterium]|nr:hypothetical protein [Pseudomonadales bacterium]
MFILLLTSQTALAEVEVNVAQLTLVDGVRYLKDVKEPFTGVAVDYYSNGQKRLQVDYRHGIKQGKEIAWYQDGQLKYVVRYHRGEPQALGSSWYAKNRGEKRPQEFLRCEDLLSFEITCPQRTDSLGKSTLEGKATCESEDSLLEVCHRLTRDVRQIQKNSLVFCNGQADMQEVCGAEEGNDSSEQSVNHVLVFCNGQPDMVDVCGADEDEVSSKQNAKFVFCDGSARMAAVCGR